MIREVIIKSRSGDSLSSGFKTTSIDYSLLKDYNNKTMAEVLNDNSAVFIKNYGAGGIATPSFRGTGPGHTQLEWNSINLNNPMTGQSDLSLLPAGMTDRVAIFYGGSSMSLNSGGIGGIINMESMADWNNRFSLLLNPEAGSFGRYSGFLRINAGNPGFQSVTKAFLLTAENNFPFLNTFIKDESGKEFRENNQVKQNGYMQEFYAKLPKGVLSAKLWFQSAFRNLPVPIVSLPSAPGEKQRDQSFRSVLNFASDNVGNHLEITAAMVCDYLNYINSVASIDSRNRSNSFFLRAVLEKRIGSKTKLKADFKNELNIINTNNYSGTIARNNASGGVMAETAFCDWLQTRLLVRETLLDDKLLVPDFSAGAQLRIITERNYFITASLSRNSRIPSLNDMYWAPGGNPDLRNETGWLSEISLSADQDFASGFTFKSGITFFNNNIRDMIQWRPGDFSYWEADNIGRINTSGLESSLNLGLTKGSLNLHLNAGYTLTIAESTNNNRAGKQLIYIPANRVNGVLKAEWKHFYTRIVTDFTGRRFLDEENSSYLPSYFVNDLDLGTMFKLRHSSFSISFNINNVFNISYQNIAWYPMPGRAFLASIAFNFNK
jgi:outer membrane cobalamin receptor